MHIYTPQPCKSDQNYFFHSVGVKQNENRLLVIASFYCYKRTNLWKKTAALGSNLILSIMKQNLESNNR
jgi:hypothetical protein